MLTCFNLKVDVTMDSFQDALSEFTAHMKSKDMVVSTGPVGKRQSDTIMDTDSERDHQHFFLMTFRDRAQCDKAVKYLLPHQEPGESAHKAVYTKVTDQIFICWEDM